MQPNAPLLIGDGLNCIIGNIPKWIQIFGGTNSTGFTDCNYADVKELMKIKVVGCTLEFPNEETKIWFMMKYC